MRAWQAFLAAAALLDRRLDQQLKEATGLSHPQYEILVRLAAPRAVTADDRPGRCPLHFHERPDLPGRAIGEGRAGAPHLFPADVRGVVAALTDAGRERLAQAAPGHVAAVRALLIDVLTGAAARRRGGWSRRGRPPPWGGQ